MKAKKIYLEGGGDVKKDENIIFDREAITNSKNKIVYVIDLSSDNKERVASYRQILEKYFKNLGASRIGFISLASPKEMKSQIEDAGIVYIPGGDTEVLIGNIKINKLEKTIKEYQGTIIGNSAGAMLLCKESICANEIHAKRGMIKGIGMLDFAIDVHYNSSHDAILANTKSRLLYAIPEKGAIIIDSSGKLTHIGNIYLFSGGIKKELI